MAKLLRGRGMRWLKIAHLIFVAMWIGGALGLLLLIFITPQTENPGVLSGWYRAMRGVDDFIIIPGAMGCLLTGILYGALTPWGWFRHRWITVKWVITVVGILFGTFSLGPWLNALGPIVDEHGLNLAATDYAHNRRMLSLFAPVQVSTLLFALAISTLKPWKKNGGSKQKDG